MRGAGQPLGAMQMMAIEGTRGVLFRALVAAIRGRLWRSRVSGVHRERGDEIRIESDHSSVILDGELFEARADRPIVLTPTAPVPGWTWMVRRSVTMKLSARSVSSPTS